MPSAVDWWCCIISSPPPLVSCSIMIGRLAADTGGGWGTNADVEVDGVSCWSGAKPADLTLAVLEEADTEPLEDEAELMLDRVDKVETGDMV